MAAADSGVFRLAPLRWVTEGTTLVLILGLIAFNWTHFWVDYLATGFRADPLASYDFIVVGGGSAGAAAAFRLSENGQHSVLLLEAGGTPSFVAHLPAMAMHLQETNLNWNYFTEPQEHGTKAFNDKRSHWPRGKVLGGSSILNYMVYVRGNRRDYDYWNELGNEGWSYEEVLPFFMKSERNRGESVDDKYHGRDGPLSVEDRIWVSQLAKGFLEAGTEMGYEIMDINGANQTGFAIPQVSMNQGERCSTYAAFLSESRPNLHIVTHAMVEKILIDESNTAYGVQYRQHGQTKSVRASKEIVVSAGAIGSPQILMLSGIGPKDHLDSLQIPVISDRKVGYNLQDHITTSYGPLLHNDTTASFNPLNLKQWWDYLVWRKGILTGNSIDGTTFKTTSKSEEPNWPDIQLFLLPISFATGNDKTIMKKFNIMEDHWSFYEPWAEMDTSCIFVALVRPKSRGRVWLRSSNPEDHPVIDPRYFSHPDDVEAVFEGIRFTEEIISQPGMQRFNMTLPLTPYPTCKDHPVGSEPYWRCYIDQTSFTLYHPAGTCKMGPESDPDAVVDPQLRVYGVKGLRVADASIMPTVINGNTNAPSIMIGEKVADMILKTWEKSIKDLPKLQPDRQEL